ncbi:hypothetical protein BC659_0882 [Sediminibacterium goheungense]|uniref:Uncharacterized protein n=1 Tax=Sediminibacterium goheungense TaxID=1086393 RepID=A0A4R6J0R2_9BACT|nr:hypothetical protein BC659_0882 [Sediminibacterium goheungense]
MEHKVEIRQMFDESFKRKVIEEYLSTRQSKMSIQCKYNIHFKSAICTWMKRLGYTEKVEQKCNLALILRSVFPADVSRGTRGLCGSLALVRLQLVISCEYSLPNV